MKISSDLKTQYFDYTSLMVYIIGLKHTYTHTQKSTAFRSLDNYNIGFVMFFETIKEVNYLLLYYC